MKLVSIGFGNIVSSDRIITIVTPESAPIKRIVQVAKEKGILIDSTCGRKSRSVLIMDSGHIILSAVQPETVAGRVDKDISSVSTQGLHVDKNATSNVDKSKPTCKVNIRLFNGEVVSEDFNLTQTLQDVINFVRKKSGSNNFSLLDGFPPRPITTYNKTIQELHLEGSLLTQKIN